MALALVSRNPRTAVGRVFPPAAFALSALGLLVGCGPSTHLDVGMVVAVDARSLTDVRGFTLRLEDGTTVPFEIGQLEDAAAFPVSHLAEHMVTATPIAVAYRLEGGRRTAVRLADAAWATR